MRALFVGIALLGLAYHALAKRSVDLLTVAFVSAVLYFAPGFFGYALYPTAGGFANVELVPETYWIMTSVLTLILVASVVFDLTCSGSEPTLAFRGASAAPYFAAMLALSGFGLAVLTTGSALLTLNKGQMLAQMNRWHTLWAVGASTGAVLSFALRRRVVLAICILLLLFDVFIGSRSSFAVTVIAMFMLWLFDRGRRRLLVGELLPVAALLVFGVCIFSYKGVYRAVKRGHWDLVSERLTSVEYHLSRVNRSEPFTTQAILNGVVENDFHTEIDWWDGVVGQLVLLAPEMGADPVSFNRRFQPELFPHADYGMANNIWAQMWSAGGWPLLLCFESIFVVILYAGSRLLHTRDSVIQAGVALMGVYWAFYLHRNDLFYQINLEKRVFLVWFMAVACSVLSYHASRVTHSTRCPRSRETDENGRHPSMPPAKRRPG